MRWLVAAVCVLAGCVRVTTTPGGEEKQIVITIDRRQAVHQVGTLTVTLKNNELVRSDTVQVSDELFPIYYQATAEGTAGVLEIDVDALDVGGALVGRGVTTTEFGVGTASVSLQGVDFTINTAFANNQFTTNDFEAAGLQLGASFYDSWMIAFRDDCQNCSIWGRRFDGTGRPLYTDLAAGPDQFALNTSPTTNASSPAVVSSSDRVVALWDFTDPSSTTQGIACRAIDLGGFTPSPITITTDAADVVSGTGTALTSNVIVTWQTFTTTQVVRSMAITSSCTTLSAPVTVSIATGTTGARRAHVAAADSVVAYTWIVDGELHARFGLDTGELAPTETVLLPRTATQEVEFARIVRWADRDMFALAVRWGAISGTGPGKIELYTLSTSGTLSPPILITDQSGSDFASNKAFGLASRADGTLMVVWHACPEGPGTCDVFGRYVHSGFGLVDGPFVVPTNTASDQVNPSVAAHGDVFVTAWTDSSGVAPDASGTAVRARITEPEL